MIKQLLWREVVLLKQNVYMQKNIKYNLDVLSKGYNNFISCILENFYTLSDKIFYQIFCPNIMKEVDF